MIYLAFVMGTVFGWMLCAIVTVGKQSDGEKKD